MNKPQSPSPTIRESILARLLDPVSRLVEAMYSVLIVLTFTLAYQISQSNEVLTQEDAVWQVSQMFVSALGCAVAWGLLDGIMYIATAMFDRGEEHRLIATIHNATTEQEGAALLAGQLDEKYVPITTANERATLYRALYKRLRDRTPAPVGFKQADFAGALGVALVAAGAAIPVVLPLLFFQNQPVLAVRISNTVAFVMLFAMGYQWGKHVGAVPWKTGLALLGVGILMLAVAIPLGG